MTERWIAVVAKQAVVLTAEVAVVVAAAVEAVVVVAHQVRQIGNKVVVVPVIINQQTGSHKVAVGVKVKPDGIKVHGVEVKIKISGNMVVVVLAKVAMDRITATRTITMDSIKIGVDHNRLVNK